MHEEAFQQLRSPEFVFARSRNLGWTAGSAPATLSTDHAMETAAFRAFGFVTLYRRTAIGNPESSASSGEIGVNASRRTRTGIACHETRVEPEETRQ